jgi:hypothetical protein
MTTHNHLMQESFKYRVGFRFGLITGLLYAILLYLRYRVLSSNPLSFGIFTAVSYLIILLLYTFAGIAQKKLLGGYGEMKDIFQAIFITILIAEMAYVIFNFFYLKYFNPSFWDDYRSRSIQYCHSVKLTDAQIDQIMNSLKDVDKETRPFGLLKGYGFAVVVDSIFGLIVAAILRKRKPAVIETF